MTLYVIGQAVEWRSLFDDDWKPGVFLGPVESDMTLARVGGPAGARVVVRWPNLRPADCWAAVTADELGGQGSPSTPDQVAGSGSLLFGQLGRSHESIRAMQQRQRKWMGPILDILWRKPWKSPSGVGVSWAYPLEVNVLNFWQWLFLAHDCSDPSVACSCSGGFRFPDPRSESGRLCSSP